MTFGEARRIYNNLKEQIQQEIENQNTNWTQTELFCRLSEIQKAFSTHELIESLNLIDEK